MFSFVYYGWKLFKTRWTHFTLQWMPTRCKRSSTFMSNCRNQKELPWRKSFVTKHGRGTRWVERRLNTAKMFAKWRFYTVLTPGCMAYTLNLQVYLVLWALCSNVWLDCLTLANELYRYGVDARTKKSVWNCVSLLVASQCHTAFHVEWLVTCCKPKLANSHSGFARIYSIRISAYFTTRVNPEEWMTDNDAYTCINSAEFTFYLLGGLHNSLHKAFLM